MDKILNFSEAALNYLRESIKSENCLGIRIDVVTGGCQGMTYAVDFVKEADPSDLLVQENDVKIYLAPRAVLFINGMNVDYVKNAMGGNIVFENPNAKATCGCGKSFCTENSENMTVCNGSGSKCCH